MTWRFDITVRNAFEGDVLKVERDVTEDVLDQLREQYDEPWHDVVIDREWEAVEESD